MLLLLSTARAYASCQAKHMQSERRRSNFDLKVVVILFQHKHVAECNNENQARVGASICGSEINERGICGY